MRKTFLRLGSLFALLAVTLGAFGAHGLKAIIEADSLNTFEIGVRYQFYHAFALLAAGLLAYSRKVRLLQWAGWCFVVGILLFSGSLYLLALKDALSLPVAWLGPVTPIGGVFFIIGWALFFVSTFKENELSYRRKEG
jgi:uncharacterized membrane protein YgdD (TMEM256/DUF423 family)